MKWFFITLLAAAPLSAAEDYTMSFLDIGVGARALGMGSAFTGVANDGTAGYWNPAGISFVPGRQLSGMYGPQFGSIGDPLAHFHFIGFTQPLAGGAAVSVSWIRLAIDDIPVYSELQGDSYWERYHDPSLRPTGIPEASLQDTEDALFFTFAKKHSARLDPGWHYDKIRADFSAGLNLKLIRQTLGDYSAAGIGVDAGLLCRFHIGDLLGNDKAGVFGAGLMITDITSSRMTWNTNHQDERSASVRWGVTYSHPVQALAGDLRFAYDRDARYNGTSHFGLEYQGLGLLSMRTGISGGHVTAGAGISFWQISVDYCFLSHELDSLHRLSCSLVF